MLTRLPIKVAVLCSSRAPGLTYLLNCDPNRSVMYDIVCCITSETTFAEEVRVERRAVPTLAHPIHDFCRRHDRAIGDRPTRVRYDADTVRLLEPFKPDLIVLASYLYLLTVPMLEAFPSRIINLHHSDLLLRNGGTRYPGLHAVRDAILGGEIETRATSHIVTERLDDGPILLRSWSFPVSAAARWAVTDGATDIARASAFAHREWMLRSAWGPMLATSIALIAEGFAAGCEPIDVVADGPRELSEWGRVLTSRMSFALLEKGVHA